MSAMNDLLFAGDGMRLALTAAAQQQIRQAAAMASPLETCGLLFGVYGSSAENLGQLDTAIVLEAPVAAKLHGPSSCETDTELAERLCRERWPSTYYLGRWHTHPNAAPTPSAIDLATAIELTASPAEKCSEHAMIIMGGTSQAPLWSVTIARYGQAFELHPVDWPSARQVIGMLGAGVVHTGVGLCPFSPPGRRDIP